MSEVKTTCTHTTLHKNGVMLLIPLVYFPYHSVLAAEAPPTPTFTLTPTAGPGGNIGPNEPQAVTPNAQLMFAVAPKDGYSIDKVSGCDGTPLENLISPTIYTTGPVTSDCTVNATFKIQQPLQVTLNPPSGGAVAVTATPNEGYEFLNFSGDCSGATCVLANGTNPANVVANFVRKTYSLTAIINPPAGGVLVCDANPVTHGDTVTCTAKPNEGYDFLNFSGDCNGATCVIADVTAPKTIAVHLALKTYPIVTTVNPQRGGKLVCDTNSIVHGGSSLCNCQPKPGYNFIDFAGDCTGATCTLTNVTHPQHVTCNLESPLKVLIHDVKSDCKTTTAVVSVLDRHNVPLSKLEAKNFNPIAVDGTALKDCTITTPKSAVLVPMVLDRSGSMKGAPMDSLKVAAKEFINNLGPDDQAAIFSFSSAVTLDQEWTSNKNLLYRAIDRLRASGDTALFSAVDDATAYAATVASSGERVSLVVMADGDNNAGAVKEGQLETNILTRGLPIHTIGLGNIQGRALQNIAFMSNGAYYKAATPGDLSQIYQQISTVLNSQYEINCPALTCDNKVHELNVTVDTQDGFGMGMRRYLSTAPMPPTAITKSATAITATSVILNGAVNDNGAITNVSFDFSPVTTCQDLTYSFNAAATSDSIKANAGETAVNLPISGLLICNHFYRFRVKAVNKSGISYGEDATFNTLACPATAFTIIPAATVGGHVTPSGPQVVPPGAIEDFTLTADNGYARDVKVGGTCPQGSWNDNIWSTGAIDADCTVEFNFTCQSDSCAK